MGTQLKDIYFGEVEGKDEVSGVGKNFSKVFYKHDNTYNDMLVPKKFLVIGRKGTGKTLLGEYFKSQCNEFNTTHRIKKLCEIYDDSNFALKKLEKFDYTDITEDEMAVFWEYFFLIQVSALLLSSKHRVESFCSIKYRKLSKFVSDYSFKLGEITKNKKRNYEASKEKNGVLSKDDMRFSSGKEIKESYVPSSYYDDLPKIKKLLKSILKSSREEIYTIYDDIDELENMAKDPKKSITFIYSMIKTAKRLNNEFFSKNKKVKIFILLRQDMCEDLIQNTSNFNKILISGGIKLNWQYNGKIPLYRESLSKMIVQKIRESSSEFQGMSDADIYNKIMPKKVSRRNAVKYLIDYSFGRPRDFVMFLNIVKEKYGDKESIKAHMISNSMSQYSQQFWNELENEIHRNKKKDSILDCITIIKDMSKSSFSFSEINDTFEGNKERYSNIKNETDLRDLLVILYRYSIIGSSKFIEREGKRKVKIEFYYRGNVADAPNFQDYFSVHFALRSAFSIVG